MTPSDSRENKATIVRWRDGDTCEVEIIKELDLDFDFKSECRFKVALRVRAFDAPEKRIGLSEGIAAKQHAEKIAPPGTLVRVISYKDKSFDRYIADIILPNGGDFAGAMRQAGHDTGKYQ